MNYANFGDSITRKYGVVIEHWPLPTFCSPSDIKTRNEVSVLFNAWSSGTARFRRLSNEEWEAWEAESFQSALNSTLQRSEETSAGNVDPEGTTDEQGMALFLTLSPADMHNTYPHNSSPWP